MKEIRIYTCKQTVHESGMQREVPLHGSLALDKASSRLVVSVTCSAPPVTLDIPATDEAAPRPTAPGLED